MLALLALLACDPGPPAMSEAEVADAVAATTDASRQLTLLEVHVTRNPDSANAHLWLARAYRERGDARAAEHLERAAALDPANPIPRVELAYYLLEPALRRGVDPAREELDRALGLGREALGASPTCETRRHVVGLYELRLEAGIVDPELVDWLGESLAACEADPALTIAWKATLGRAHAVAGRAPEAERWLCEAASDGHVTAAADCLDAVKARGGDVCGTPARLHEEGEPWVTALKQWDCAK